MFRAYPNTRNEDDRQQETLITEGKVADEVYAMQQNGQLVIETATYTQQTTAKTEQSAENTVQVTIDRAVGALENSQVKVSGGAAARMSSSSALTAGIDSGSPRYMVRQRAAAQTHADVLIAFDNFSIRTATSNGSESSTTGATTAQSDGTSADGGADATTENSPGSARSPHSPRSASRSSRRVDSSDIRRGPND